MSLLREAETLNSVLMGCWSLLNDVCFSETCTWHWRALQHMQWNYFKCTCRWRTNEYLVWGHASVSLFLNMFEYVCLAWCKGWLEFTYHFIDVIVHIGVHVWMSLELWHDIKLHLHDCWIMRVVSFVCFMLIALCFMCPVLCIWKTYFYYI